MDKPEIRARAWDAISNTPGAANLQARSQLMRQIALVKAKGWKQTKAAQHCGVTQPRLNDLLRGRVSRFSLDAVVNIAAPLATESKSRLMRPEEFLTFPRMTLDELDPCE